MMFHSIKRLGRKTYKEQTLQLISTIKMSIVLEKRSPSKLPTVTPSLDVHLDHNYDFSLYKYAPWFTHIC